MIRAAVPMARALLALVLLGGGAAAAHADWHARGQFFYRDREQDLNGFTGSEPDLPARRVDVQVIDANTSAVLASGATDLTGTYDVLVPDGSVRDVRVRAVTSSTRTTGLFLSVRRSSVNPQTYAVTSAIVAGHAPTADVDFPDLTALPEAGGEAFNIYDVLLNGLDTVKLLHGAWPSPALVAYWQDTSADGTYFSFASNSIHFLAGEGYDDTVIGHEQGHFVLANYSRDQSPGGQHFLGDNNQDLRLAWSEGFATWFASVARKRTGAGPVITYYVNATGAPGAGNLDFSYELEGPSVGAIGGASEVSVQAVLWDATDAAPTPDDTPGVDDDPLSDRTEENVWEVIRNYLSQPSVASPSLEDFWDGWFRPGPGHGRQPEMTAIFASLDIEYFLDARESDGSIGSARPLQTDVPHRHTFYPVGDLDYGWFAANNGETFLAETTDLISDGNTTLSIVDSTGAVLATNDNRSGGDASSRIVFTAPATARYFTLVQHALDVGVYGSYVLRLFRGAPSTVTFQDVTVTAGVGHTGSGRGAAWGDYNGDTFPDLYICNLGTANALYRNQANGTFADATGTAGVGLNTQSEGACFGDYDNDGDLDLYVSTVGSADALFKNQRIETGTASFVNVTVSAGITDVASGRSVNWVDADRDGLLDLFVANIDVGTSRLWLNDGDGTFTDGTAAAGLGIGGVITSCWSDYDRDGDDDAFLGVNGGPSRLLRNDGGVFVDVTATAGVTAGIATFAADWGDFDNDGWFDLTVADADAQNSLYRNLGNGTFAEVGFERGAASVSQSVGSIFFDHDLDGDLDLFVANFNSPNQLHDNLTGSSFTVTGAANFTARSRSVAWSDYDRDGDPDLFVPTEPPTTAGDVLLRNMSPSRPFLQIDLIGRTSNRMGVGARVLVSAQGRRQTRQVYAGQGFGSQNQIRLLFGLGAGAPGVDTVIVDWPSGKRSLLTNLAVSQLLTVDEAGAIAAPDPLEQLSTIRLGMLTANPARGRVELLLEVPLAASSEPIALDVYDAAGRRIAELVRGPLPAGAHRIAWSPASSGARVAAGVYLVRLRAPSISLTRKIVLLGN